MIDRTEVQTAIVGTGFSGLGMAIQLKRAGRDSFVLLEKASDLGGTWRENHYPGCACDVPSHLYSFSFEPNPHWSRMYAPQAEILAYLKRCAERHGIVRHMRFGSEVTRAELDERRGTWRLTTADGASVTAHYVVFGLGALSRPAYPDIDGLRTFRGPVFHSAEWDHQCVLDGKNVAVVGTGASAIQFVPRIAPLARRLHLFQRTPPWVLPKPDRAMTARERKLFASIPWTQKLLRAGIYCLMDLTGFGFSVDPGIMRRVEALGRRHIARQLPNPSLRDTVTPRYTPGCKRILLSNDYYPALARSNVEVVTQPISEVRERGIVTADGRERPADVIILGTGFRVTDLLTPMQVLGRGGVDINDVWQERVEAYRGTTVAGFPNLFFLMGPNTGLGNNSMVFVIEAQVHYVLEYMRALERRGARFADVRRAAQTAFNAKLQERLGRSVWATGCRSWYLDRNGWNSVVWPGFSLEFWLATRRLRAGDYDFDPVLGAAFRKPQAESA